MIVLENKRENYYFITCFIVKGERNIDKQMQRYEEDKQFVTKQKTATIVTVLRTPPTTKGQVSFNCNVICIYANIVTQQFL